MKETIRVVNGKAKAKPDPNALGFGSYFTDHMFMMDYSNEQGWHDPRIVPYAPLQLDPAAMVLHYGQAVFEGLKAYRAEDGRVLLFRPGRNAARFNLSNERLTMPQMDESDFIEAVKALVAVDAGWVPELPGASLYIRPFIIATEAALGVRPSSRYLFVIILSPVGSYYGQGMKPVDIYVEDRYVRAVRGGLGVAKTPANYASSLKAQELAKREHYDQVLWLDAVESRYIEEVGSMNVFFRINGEFVTPLLSGSILDGVTRSSIIELINAWGYEVSERRIAIDEVYRAHAEGTLQEVFGTGTAAVVAPVGSLCWNGERIEIGRGEAGEMAARLYETLTGIQYGRLPDEFGWTVTCLE
ncbi:branched-chain amino acid aminotransferase [Paenibacillus humicola]|uniref:branched-chain amino acid aminotransferase n=1 Tax=Paenibacillus humicola TaxID=3110540 RepID=UPI00237A3863|nr:branched-chain amino acid aminotransferase [Paenibacillus humicola]